MQKDIITVALVQITSVDSLAANLHKFETAFSSIKPGSVDLVCFPENCLFMRIKESDSIEKFDLSHSCFMWLGEWARRLGATIHLGSVPLFINGQLYNSTVWFSEIGEPQIGYQKMHLFDIELEGQKPIRESALFAKGSAGRLHSFKGWGKASAMICDLVSFFLATPTLWPI